MQDFIRSRPGPSPSHLRRSWRASRGLIVCLGLVFLIGETLIASDRLYNFDPPKGDPRLIPGLVLFGANTQNAWHTNNGVGGSATDGFLEITPAQNNMNLGILFPVDYFTNADGSLVPLPLEGFLFEADVRIGDATGNNGLPGEGFSVSFADQHDPVIYWGSQGVFRGWAGGYSVLQALEPSSLNYATGTGVLDPLPCDSVTAENGTKSGVAVQFEDVDVQFRSYEGNGSGNTIVDENGTATDRNDNSGWRVHYNGKLLKRILAQPPSGPLGNKSPYGTNDLNGLAVWPAYNATFDQDTAGKALVCVDTNCIQTGTYNATNNGSVSSLCWSHVSVELTPNTPHELTVTYKGRAVVDHLVLTNFYPFVGRLILGGSTVEENENCDIDNVHIVTYPVLQALFKGVTSASSFINDFTLNMENIGPAQVTNVSRVILDGTDVTSDTIISIGDPVSAATFYSATNFAPGSAHTAGITFSDTLGTVQTNTIGFTALPWAVLPASLAVPVTDTSSTNMGFRIQAHQTLQSEPNRMYWADEQLMGLHGTNWIDFPSVGVPLTPEGDISDNNVVDFSNGSGSNGEFPVNRDFGAIGIPSLLLPNDNNSAMSVSAYLYFPTPGTYVMGANSDDGMRVTFARNSHDLLGTQVPGLLADSPNGRGISGDQNVCMLVVTTPGYYGFRLLYENGGGGAALEWYTKSTPAGVANILINDTLTPGSVAAYQVSSAAPPYVGHAKPPLNDDQVRSDEDFQWKLTDAATTVNSGSVVLKLNGLTQAPTIGSSGGVTSISLPHTPGQPHPQGTNIVDLSFKDSAGTNYAYNYSFVVPPPPTISVGKQGNSWVLTYTGTLYASSTVNGMYAVVVGASNPYTVPTGSGPSQCYRAHQ